MSELVADVATPKARSYVGRVCGHFAHKVPVERDGDLGAVTFEAGRCDLRADGDVLRLRVSASDAESAAEVADIVERHLVRFATREGLSVSWRAPD